MAVPGDVIVQKYNLDKKYPLIITYKKAWEKGLPRKKEKKV